MAVVTVSTTLDAPADVVRRAVCSPVTFRFVTRGLLSMPALRERTAPWRTGERLDTRLLLFGVLPFSVHDMEILEVDGDEHVLRTNERGGLLRRWDHEIVVTPLTATSCRYEDTVAVDAGVLTAAVAVIASGFFRLRQRRWRQLGRVLGGMALVDGRAGSAPAA